MSNGFELMSLKQNAFASHNAVKNREERGVWWFFGCWLIALVAGAAGFTTIMYGLLSFARFSAYSAYEPFLRVGSGVALMALAVLAYYAPFAIRSRDKELNRLESLKETAYSTYHQALIEEIASYGVDTTTIKDRTNYKDGDYDFTALRNGDPIDVIAREYNNEIVFMLNGERMKKPVAA